ncbi:hypothetical protein SDC9_173640 [bioreactor metagenome]|uniref:Uncharacterized protein n=1 Tax=bioreactor metagenome TaxID=1076179 RepID=A0A645GJ01_9ZZZZ
MRRHLLLHAMQLMLCVGLCTGPAAHAARKAKSSAESSTTRSSAVKIKPSKNDSSESVSERDKRLYRECRGLPNAGACSGYTRK